MQQLENREQKFVLLDSVAIPIEGDVGYRPVNPWIGQVASGGAKVYGPTSTITWEKLQGGWGKERWEEGHNDRIWYGNIDTSSWQTTLPGLVTSWGTLPSGVTTDPTVVTSFQGTKFVFGNGYALFRDTSNNEWANAGQVLIEDCEDAWNEDVDPTVVSEVATPGKRGTNCIKLTVDATTPAGTILATEQITSLDLSKCSNVQLWVKSTINMNAGDLQLLLDNTAACASPLETLNLPALTANTWTLVNVALADAASDTAIVSVGVKLTTDKAAFYLYLDDIKGALPNPTSALVYYDSVAGSRKLCLGTQAKGIWTTTSSTGDGTWTQAYTAGTWLTTFRGRLCALYYQYKGFCYSDVGDLTTANWTAEANFPNIPYNFKNLYTGKNVAGEDALYFGTDDGLYYIDFDTLTFNPVITWSARDEGGQCALFWKGDHYVTTGKGILKLSGSVVTQVGPDMDDGQPSGYVGYINSMVVTDYWLIISVKGTSTNYGHILKRYIGGGTWHFVSEVLTLATYVSGNLHWQDGNLYYSESYSTNQYVKYVPFPDDTDNQTKKSTYTYAASGSVILPYFDGGPKLSTMPKLALRCWALVKDCDADETIVVKYRTDENSSYTTLGTFNTSPLPTALTFQTASVNVGLAFYRIQLELDFARGSTNTNSPKLEAFTFEWIPVPPTLQGWQFTVNAETANEANVQYTGKALIDKLWSLYGNSTLFTFYPDGDKSNTQYIVKISDMRGIEQSGRKRGRSGKYVVSVQEVFDS